MARTKFPVKVLTPEGLAFEEEVEMIATTTENGSLGILAGHRPVLAGLAPAELRLYRSGDEIVRFAQGEGYLQVTKEGTTLLVEEAIDPRKLDVANLREKLTEAEQKASETEHGSQESIAANRDVRRWKKFIELAENSK